MHRQGLPKPSSTLEFLINDIEWELDPSVIRFRSVDGSCDLTNIQVLKASDPVLLDWAFDGGCVSYNAVRSIRLDMDDGTFPCFFDASVLTKVRNNVVFPICPPTPFSIPSAGYMNREAFVVKNIHVDGGGIRSAFVNTSPFKSLTNNLITMSVFGFTTSTLPGSEALRGIYDYAYFCWFSPPSNHVTFVSLNELVLILGKFLQGNFDLICMILSHLPFQPKLVEIRMIMAISGLFPFSKGIMDSEPVRILPTFNTIDEIQCVESGDINENKWIPCNQSLYF